MEKTARNVSPNPGYHHDKNRTGKSRIGQFRKAILALRICYSQFPMSHNTPVLSLIRQMHHPSWKVGIHSVSEKKQKILRNGDKVKDRLRLKQVATNQLIFNYITLRIHSWFPIHDGVQVFGSLRLTFSRINIISGRALEDAISDSRIGNPDTLGEQV